MDNESKKEKDLHYRRKTKVRNMIDADYTLNQIAKHMNLHQAVVDKIYQEVLEELRCKEQKKKNTFGYNYFGQASKVGSLVGSRQEPYYDPKIYSEERLMNLPPKYDYNRLSDSEKEIWHNEKRTRELLRSDKEGTVGAYPPEKDVDAKRVSKNVETASNYLKSEGVDIDHYVKKGLEIIKELQMSDERKPKIKSVQKNKELQKPDKKNRFRKDESEIPLDPKLVKKIENNEPLTSEELFYELHTPRKKRKNETI